jgi:hypothetical protein
MYVVELEEGVWLAAWNGEPGCTICRTNARVFQDIGLAKRELEAARKWNEFEGAKVVPLDSSASPVQQLKAEIAALVNDAEAFIQADHADKVESVVIPKLRQISAV